MIAKMTEKETLLQ